VHYTFDKIAALLFPFRMRYEGTGRGYSVLCIPEDSKIGSYHSGTSPAAVSPKVMQLVIPEHRSGFYSDERGIE